MLVLELDGICKYSCRFRVWFPIWYNLHFFHIGNQGPSADKLGQTFSNLLGIFERKSDFLDQLYEVAVFFVDEIEALREQNSLICLGILRSKEPFCWLFVWKQSASKSYRINSYHTWRPCRKQFYHFIRSFLSKIDVIYLLNSWIKINRFI